MYNVVAKIAKKRFDNQLNNVSNRFDVNVRFMFPKEFVIREITARKANKQKIEQKQDSMKKLPLISKMIDRQVADKQQELEESEFILSLMDNLGLECLGTDEWNHIKKNKEQIYEVYYRGDYEYYTSAQISNYMANGLSK